MASCATVSASFSRRLISTQTSRICFEFFRSARRAIAFWIGEGRLDDDRS